MRVLTPLIAPSAFALTARSCAALRDGPSEEVHALPALLPGRAGPPRGECDAEGAASDAPSDGCRTRPLVGEREGGPPEPPDPPGPGERCGGAGVVSAAWRGVMLAGAAEELEAAVVMGGGGCGGGPPLPPSPFPMVVINLLTRSVPLTAARMPSSSAPVSGYQRSPKRWSEMYSTPVRRYSANEQQVSATHRRKGALHPPSQVADLRGAARLSKASDNDEPVRLRLQLWHALLQPPPQRRLARALRVFVQV